MKSFPQVMTDFPYGQLILSFRRNINTNNNNSNSNSNTRLGCWLPKFNPRALTALFIISTNFELTLPLYAPRTVALNPANMTERGCGILMNSWKLPRAHPPISPVHRMSAGRIKKVKREKKKNIIINLS